MDVTDFNKNMNDFNKFDFNLNILLDKLSKENKQVYLLSDFNNW